MKIYNKKSALMALGAAIMGALNIFLPGGNFYIGSMVLIYLAAIEITLK